MSHIEQFTLIFCFPEFILVGGLVFSAWELVLNCHTDTYINWKRLANMSGLPFGHRLYFVDSCPEVCLRTVASMRASETQCGSITEHLEPFSSFLRSSVDPCPMMCAICR